MVNVYMFRSDSTTPTGWTDNSATYEGKYPIIVSSGALETGGSNTHTHTVTGAGTSVPNPNTTSRTQATVSSNCVEGTNHTHTASVTLSTVNHEPTSKTVRIVSRNITGWSIVPNGNICFVDSLSGGTYTMYGSSDCYIKISTTPGTSITDSGSHSHTSNGTTGNSTSGSTCSKALSNGPSATHNHTWNGSTGATNSPDWACYKGYMEQANIDTVPLVGQKYLFDGDPGIGWSNADIDVNTNGRYLFRIVSGNASNSGTNITLSHNHTLSITTSGESATALNQGIITGKNPATSHVHSIIGTVASPNLTLAYVKFLMYKYLGATMSYSIVMTC